MHDLCLEHFLNVNILRSNNLHETLPTINTLDSRDSINCSLYLPLNGFLSGEGGGGGGRAQGEFLPPHRSSGSLFFTTYLTLNRE